MRTQSFFFFFLLVITTSTYGQKVGLVLSGGGAKGLAHIGAIKALEENDIPIDYVVGTSMGGIIGGMYAAGYSPEEMEMIATNPQFQKWLEGIIGEAYEYNYTERAPNSSILSLDMAVDSTLTTTLNKNLANDLAINFVFAELLAQASERANNNFDSLLVPFRTVAAEVATETQVILKAGLLSEAVRATMTVPMFYRPIKIEDRYLFDGGLYNNFPADVALKEFSPGYLIGIDVGMQKLEDYPYGNDQDIQSDLLSYIFLKKSDPSKIGNHGIYVRPDLGRNTSLDFANAKALIDSGYVATINKIEEIKSDIIGRRSKEVLTKKREDFKSDFKPLKFGEIKLSGFDTHQQTYVKNLFEKENKVIELEQLRSGYFRLVSENYFKTIYPRMEYNATTGLFDFEINSEDKRNFKVQLGGNIATRSISQIYLDLQYNYLNRVLSSMDLNFYMGQFYRSLQFVPRFYFASKKPFYIEPEITLNSWKFNDAEDLVFKNTPGIILEQTDRKFGLNLGFAAGNKGKLTFQAAIIENDDKYSNTSEVTPSDTLDHLSFNGQRISLLYSRNSMNRKQYPDEGELFSASLNFFNGTEYYSPGSTAISDINIQNNHSWFRINLKAEKYFKFNRFSIAPAFEAVFSDQPFFQTYQSTLIYSAAFYPLQDSRSLYLTDYRALNFVTIGVRNVIKLKKSFDFRLEGHTFKPLNLIVQDQNGFPTTANGLNLRYVAAANIVYHSLLGPISLGLNYYSHGNQKLGAILHLGYILYNKKSME